MHWKSTIIMCLALLSSGGNLFIKPYMAMKTQCVGWLRGRWCQWFLTINRGGTVRFLSFGPYVNVFSCILCFWLPWIIVDVIHMKGREFFNVVPCAFSLRLWRLGCIYSLISPPNRATCSYNVKSVSFWNTDLSYPFCKELFIFVMIERRLLLTG